MFRINKDKIREKKEIISKSLTENVGFNYVYFGFFLFLLLLLNIHHNFLIGSESLLPRLYFLLYSIGQTFIELVLLVVIGQFIRKYLPKMIYYAFIACSFLLLLSHIVDFLLVRLMDMSFWYALEIVLEESFDNFIEMIYLTGIDIKIWLLAIPMVLLIPIGGVFLYLYTQRISLKKPLKISRSALFFTSIFVPVALITIDSAFYTQISKNDSEHFKMVLPWKSTFFSKMDAKLVFSDPLKHLRNEKNVKNEIAGITESKEALPNIYLFITESLRDDFIESSYAPNLSAFKEENVSFSKSISNANYTHGSWYSIFHSNYSLYWSKARQAGWQSGSVPLQILKKLGYKIHVYSAAGLKYYGLDELIFGKGLTLADEYNLYAHYAPKEAWESDQEAVSHLLSDLDKKENATGQVFITFLDSTHFDYSWPKNFPVKFKANNNLMGQVRLVPFSNELEFIKNRYRNSIQYVDSLFGTVIAKMKANNLYETALMAFMGDHGEEFTEEGQLFHASHLSSMQTRACLLYKLGDNALLKEAQNKVKTTSHMDIFPTFLDYLKIEKPFHSLFDGESLLDPNRSNFILSTRYNGGKTPTEFFLLNDKYKIILRFENARNIFDCKTLSILKIQNANYEIIDFGNTFIESSEIQAEFKDSFKRLFN